MGIAETRWERNRELPSATGPPLIGLALPTLKLQRITQVMLMSMYRLEGTPRAGDQVVILRPETVVGVSLVDAS